MTSLFVPKCSLETLFMGLSGSRGGRMGGVVKGNNSRIFSKFMNSNFCFWETGACFKAVKSRWGNLATWQVVKHFNQSGVLLKGLLNNFQQGGTSEKLIPHSMLYPLRDWYCVFVLYFGFYIHDSHINWNSSFINILRTHMVIPKAQVAEIVPWYEIRNQSVTWDQDPSLTFL